jgi:hypothetical protein
MEYDTMPINLLLTFYRLAVFIKVKSKPGQALRVPGG